MAGKMIHEMGQEAEINLKDPILLGCFSDSSGSLSMGVIRR